MMASCSPAPMALAPERASQVRVLASAEAAFRDALIESFNSLALCDRNLLRFHYCHGLGPDQLAELFASHRAAVLRQLGRLRERVLRDTLRGLTARISLDKHRLDRL